MELSGLQCTGCRLYLRLKEVQTVITDESYVVMDEVFRGERPCPDCSEEMLPRFDKRIQGGEFNIVDVDLEELWLALNGRGTPDQLVTIQRVEYLFKNESIESIELSVSPGGHTRIHMILFDSGEGMHFAVSDGYAAVYKITNSRGADNARKSHELRNEDTRGHGTENASRSVEDPSSDLSSGGQEGEDSGLPGTRD